MYQKKDKNSFDGLRTEIHLELIDFLSAEISEKKRVILGREVYLLQLFIHYLVS